MKNERKLIKLKILLGLFCGCIILMVMLQLLIGWPFSSITGDGNRVAPADVDREKGRPYWENQDPATFLSKIEIPYSTSYLVAVYKNAHILRIIKEKKTVREYKTNVRNELPDRLLEDDYQTPEGVFTIWQIAVVTDPPWSRWLAFDTTTKAKEIFRNEYADGRKILSAYETGQGEIKNDADIRLFNKRNPRTPMLRGFGIHGGGYKPGHDWTWGCPALSDRDVIELYDFILKNPDGGIGTMVIIQD
jgi:hypothetical protein